MKNVTLNSFPDANALAIAAATAWLEQLQVHSRKPGNPVYTVALSGGRITRTFFAEVVRLVQPDPQAVGGILPRIHFFWADERCVPPTDPESNYAMAQELLFGPLKIGAGQIHRLRGEGPEAEALAGAIGEITRLAPGVGGQPALDLVFLGMGEDGHTASLFPGELEAVMADPAVYRAVTAVKPPPRRITLGYAAIAAAKECWVLISGADKEAALRETLSGSGRTPLGRVLGMRAQTRVFSDVATAVLAS